MSYLYFSSGSVGALNTKKAPKEPFPGNLFHKMKLKISSVQLPYGVLKQTIRTPQLAVKTFGVYPDRETK